MFKVAPRYLSGVSVFYGDDITRRDAEGEVVFVVGQAKRGVKYPLQLKSPDHALPIYGVDSPLLKALYEFMDGYSDSPQAGPIRLVTLRVGGIPAVLSTSYGVTIETVDSYDGIENDFYVYIDNQTPTTAVTKVWDTNKMLVFDSENGIDTGAVVVTSSNGTGAPTGDGGLGTVYGVNLSSNPLAVPTTLAQMRYLDRVNPALDKADVAYVLGDEYKKGLVLDSLPPLATTSIEITGTNNDIPSAINPTGFLSLKVTHGIISRLITVEYVAFDGSVFTLATPFGVDLSAYEGLTTSGVSVMVVGSALQAGDSQLAIDSRQKYELFRNALLDIEQFTPDYIVPGGVMFDETYSYNLPVDRASVLVQTIPSSAGVNGVGALNPVPGSIIIDGAADWPKAGTLAVEFDPGHLDYLNYTTWTTTTVGNAPAYNMTLQDMPAFIVNSVVRTDPTKISVVLVTNSDNTDFLKLHDSGYLRLQGVEHTVDGNTVSNPVVPYVVADSFANYNGAVSNPPSVLVDLLYTEENDAGLDLIAIGQTVDKVPGAAYANAAAVTTVWNEPTQYEMGVGFVKETDAGGYYTFEWSDVKLEGFGLAHFGYLFAKFCNDAAVGYNTPLCGMNVTLPPNFERATINNWIGKFPVYTYVPGNNELVEEVTVAGTGLLGDPVMAGSPTYRRSYLNDATTGSFVDPAWGLLLTTEGYIDGHEVRDTYQKLVDLGKFVSVGAGILTFNNLASNVSYYDTCGIYAMGLLSGKAKNEGLSFSPVGRSSSAGISVVVHRKYYNDLARLGYIVLTREKGIGWVVNNSNSVAREGSGYYLISTTRIIKYVVEGKRSLLGGFISKPLNTYYYEAARTKLSDGFRKDMADGFLNGYTFDLQVDQSSRAIGKLYLKITINPPFELVQVDIDTVIDRNVTGGTQ